jgi:hypothetical protein
MPGASWSEGLLRSRVPACPLGRGPAILSRFRAEARHAGSLSHPGIVRVYDFGEAGPGHSPYLVMELVLGRSLARVLAFGPMEPARAMDVVAQTAAGLHAAHAAGLVHLAWECLVGAPPFTGIGVEAALAYGDRPLPSAVPAQVAALVAELMATNPAEQPSASVQLLGHLRAEFRMHIAPVLDHPRRHLRLHAGPDVADDVGDQVLPVGVAHHVAIQRAGLDEVVVVAVLVVASQPVLASQDKSDEPIPPFTFSPTSSIAQGIQGAHRQGALAGPGRSNQRPG